MRDVVSKGGQPDPARPLGSVGQDDGTLPSIGLIPQRGLEREARDQRGAREITWTGGWHWRPNVHVVTGVQVEDSLRLHV